MALKKCKDCGHEVSKKASSCPNCGAPLRKPKRKTSTFTWLVLILIGAVVWQQSNQESTTTRNTTTNKPTASAGPKKAPVAAVVNTIKIVTLENKARLCPNIGCNQGQELLRLPTNTKLKVEMSSKQRLPMWDVIWYKVIYKGKEGWVSEFNTDKAPKEPRYR